ncbi:MAG: type II toxin-antitoxin system RelE/ParE family toxin [Actinomycetota bacterium]|nr:type II toxin-antitoxin system RelE/ParE family toxin [Actinomycetota bacterium]
MTQPYTVLWSGPAKRAIGKELPEAVAAAALELILGALREDPHRVGKPLRAPMDGIGSARRATYRVLYRIDDANHAIIVETIRHRRSAYR